MAVDPEDDEGNVAAPPAPEQPTVDAGRAMGFSRRGTSTPLGSDFALPGSTPAEGSGDDDPTSLITSVPAAPAIQPTAYRPPAAAPLDRAVISAQSRAAVDQAAVDKYQDDYIESRPVDPNGPTVDPRQYRAADAAAEQQALVTQRQQRADQLAATKLQNAQREAQMRGSGQKFYQDPYGQIQPVLEPGTNRPLYNASGWEEGTDPKTGQPALTKRDHYGQRQYKTPPIIANPDLTDTQLYYKMPDGSTKPAGDAQALTKSPDFNVARAALRAVRQRRSAMWKEAIAPMESVASDATTSVEMAKQQTIDLQNQSELLQSQIDNIQANPQLNEKTGGTLGIGGTFSDAALAAQSKLAALQGQQQQLADQQAKLSEALKPTGALESARRKAALDLGIFKSKAAHDNYSDLATERRSILKQQGKSEADDPTLNSILAAQQTYGAAISRYGGQVQTDPSSAQVAAPEAPAASAPATSADSTGARLPLGAPVPGRPGLFESVPGSPAKNDPVVDPENPNAPAPAPSRFTLTTAPAPEAARATPAPQPEAPRAAAPAPPETPVGPGQSQEPFALLKSGVKSVGNVGIQELMRRYGTGSGPANPASIVKMKQRSKDIQATLDNSDTKLDAKTRDGLTAEKGYLDNLAIQRFARLSVDAQKRVTDITRDPTLLDKAKGVVKSLAGAAAEGGASALKGAEILVNSLPAPTTDEAGMRDPQAAKFNAEQAKLTPSQRLEQIKSGPAYQMGNFIGDAAKEYYEKNPHEQEGAVSKALNAAAEGAGGFGPLVASGPAAPLTIGLQTAGSEMENFYNESVKRGVSPDNAAKFAIRRALTGGAVQAALFEFLPKPLNKAADRLIVDKIAGGALKKFLANRVAGAAEGAVLGGTSAAAGNVVAGRPVGQDVLPAASGLGAIQALSPRGSRPAAESRPEAPAAAEAPKPPAAPFKPTGEGIPKSAAASADVLAPEVKAAAAQRPPPAKSAEESARVFKATDELNRRAGVKEEAAQRLVDDIQQTTGKNRGEILATRQGKDIDDWTKELQSEAKYQKNPLVVDPDRRASELREQIKQSDADWQKHIDQTATEAEQAAQIDQTKKDAGERFQAIKEGTLARHNDLQDRRQAIESELTAAERLRQSPEGGAKLKGQLAEESETSAANANKLATPELEARRDAISHQLDEAERLRQSNEGGAKLKNDLAARAAGEPSVSEKEDPVVDRARYEQIQSRMRELTKAGKTFDDPEVNALFKENEKLKNRNSSSPGMPPEPISESETQSKKETTNAPKIEVANALPLRESPAGSERIRSENAVDQGAARARPVVKAEGKETVRTEVAEPLATKHGEVEGDKINRNWTEFAPEAKGLGIPRSEMPQVRSEHRGALVNYLKGQGIESKNVLVRPRDLKPTQNEFSPEKVEAARKHEGSERKILISSDGHVVDGHHQWLAALDDPTTPMPAIKLDAPIKDLLPKVKEFPSAEAAAGATKAESTAEKTAPKEKISAEAKQRTSDRVIEALQKAKIFKPGEGKLHASDPLSIAYAAAHNTALDAAILGIKAGRSLAHMIQLAISRFRAAYPQATKVQEAKLEAAIREAHGGDESAVIKPKPEEKKAAAVLASPKAEETKTGLIDRWNKASKQGNLKQTLAYTRDAADNRAGAISRETRNTVFNELARSVPKDDQAVAQDALAFHVEAGAGGKKTLAEMRAKIEASDKVTPKWKERALAAIDYADRNYDKLKSAADLYRQFTDQQAEQEQSAGMPTLKRDNYVMHAQDVDEGGWLDSKGGMSPTGASSRKNRAHETFADSLAAGVDPKTLNAVDLLETRVKNGQTGIGLRQWQDSLKNYVDPSSKQPISMKPLRVERADGSYYYEAPKGYELETLAGTPIAVKTEYAGTIGALTDPSWWSKTKGRRLVQKLNGGGKSINLLIDTFHLGRLALRQSILKGASLTDFHVPLPSYREGKTILEHSADELTKMAKNGEIAPEALPDLLEKKKNLNLLTSAGLNIGHVADAMHQEFVRAIPGIGGINKFIFEKFQRGAMSEAALMEFERQSKSYSGLPPAEVARKVAKDLNTRFGNLGRQGLFKSRSAQDIARLIWLAPQWNEGLIRSELGGLGQIGSSVKDALTGRRIAMGALGRDMIAGTLGIFAANQILNYATRGHPTWENPEEGWGSKLSAWIPDSVGGKGSGFFLNPLGVTAEISHLLLNKYERTESGWKTAVDFLRSRASAITRPIWSAVTGETALGAKIKPGDMTKQVASDAVPLPLGASSAFSAARGIANGGNTETYPGQFQKQVMQSVGLKTDTAPSPEQRVQKLARDFNQTKKIEPAAEFYAGDYTELDNALRRDNPKDVQSELDALLEKKSAADIEKHYKSWAKHPFTGQKTRESEFIRTLDPEQKQTYLKAQLSRKAVGDRAIRAVHALPASKRLQSVSN